MHESQDLTNNRDRPETLRRIHGRLTSTNPPALSPLPALPLRNFHHCHRNLSPLSSRPFFQSPRPSLQSSRPSHAVISTARERSHAAIIRPRKGILGFMRFLASLRQRGWDHDLRPAGNNDIFPPVELTKSATYLFARDSQGITEYIFWFRPCMEWFPMLFICHRLPGNNL